VLGELRGSLCAGGYGSASGQRIHPRRCGPCAARFGYEPSILLEAFCGMPEKRRQYAGHFALQNSFFGAACSGPTRPTAISATK
jgi:hypothetical protein